MSGGVDSAVAALLVRRGAVAVTLELWRDVENDAAASCCSADAVRLARRLAHGMGLPHFTLRPAAGVPGGRRRPVPGRLRGGGDPEPVRAAATATCAWTRCSSSPTRSARPRSPPATTRGSPTDGLLRAAADPAKDQAYMLAALAPASIARMRFPLAELTKPEVRALAAEAGLPVASRADSQDLCFLAGTGKARFLARHARAGGRPGRDRAPGGRRARRAPRARITSRSASARGWASPPRSRCTCCGPAAPRSSWARATSSRRRGRGCAAPGCTARRRGRRVRLRYHARACPAASSARAAALELELGSRSTALRRARPRACCAATWSSASATISA